MKLTPSICAFLLLSNTSQALAGMELDLLQGAVSCHENAEITRLVRAEGGKIELDASWDIMEAYGLMCQILGPYEEKYTLDKPLEIHITSESITRSIQDDYLDTLKYWAERAMEMCDTDITMSMRQPNSMGFFTQVVRHIKAGVKIKMTEDAIAAIREAQRQCTPGDYREQWAIDANMLG